MTRLRLPLICILAFVLASCARDAAKDAGKAHDDHGGGDHDHAAGGHDHGQGDHAAGGDHGADDHDHAEGDHEHGGDDHKHGEGDHDHGEPGARPSVQTEAWAVTAWGGAFEIFAECDPLAAGETSVSATHVTVLQGFAPLKEGVVTAVLRGPAGSEEFRQETPKRDGIYAVSITPKTAGEYALSFRIETRSAAEVVDAGKVRVGTKAEPGGPLGESPAGGDVSFLKEQQWRTEFATAPVATGAIRESVRGPGRVRAAAGGEVLLSAPLDGVVRADASVHVGRAVRRGGTVLSLAPRAGSDRTRVELEADLEIARKRLARLDELLRVEAVSVAEVESARATVTALEARVAAANGETDAKSLAAIPAPFDGRIAEVFVIEGQSVAAGDPLVRVVRTDPLWIDVDLRPEDARLLGDDRVGLLVRPGAAADVVSFEPGRVRTVATAPAVDPRTGKITALFEVAGASLPLGQVAEVDVLLARERAGIVIPAAALVDDAGSTVVYVQPDGESFSRREVAVIVRQGERVLVEGLEPGERLVTRGGAAIRRASLTTSTLEGHVH